MWDLHKVSLLGIRCSLLCPLTRAGGWDKNSHLKCVILRINYTWPFVSSEVSIVRQYFFSSPYLEIL